MRTISDLSGQIARLDEERRRLAELSHAHDVIQRSRFAQLRAALLNLSGTLRIAGTVRRRSRIVAATQPLVAVAAPGSKRRKPSTPTEKTAQEYADWQHLFTPKLPDLEAIRRMVPLLAERPQFSIVMATYNTPESYLRAALDSVLAQIYPDWELCIADDASTDPEVRHILQEYADRDGRIKLIFRDENGHISKSSNSALSLATGEYVGFLDHDDLLAPEALYECALVVNRYPDVDMLYSDEDKVFDDGELADPFFKPDWNPDTFLSRNYTCHFGVYRRSLAEAVGGLRPGFEGSQDYDFVLRLTERSRRVEHIPKVLYHWRVHPDSTASGSQAKPYARDSAVRALEEALVRRDEPGRVTYRDTVQGTYIVRYAVRKREKVSVIIPTRDHGDDVNRCLESIFENAGYENFEVLLLDNGSTDPSSLATFESWRRREARVRVVRYDVPFNYSKINNFAVSQTDGTYVLLLNNDTEVISDDWMEAMVEQAQRPSVGAVGALLLYPDGTVQHGGVVVGLGGVAGHSHKYAASDAAGYFFTLRSINNVSAVTAACLMVRREIFDAVGGLDEGLSVAFNDVDFCLKVVAAGYRNVYLPHVQLYHFESKSRGHETTPEKVARFQAEMLTMQRRWRTQTHVDPCYSPNLTLDTEDYAIRTRL